VDLIRDNYDWLMSGECAWRHKVMGLLAWMAACLCQPTCPSCLPLLPAHISAPPCLPTCRGRPAGAPGQRNR
jgi:hypothetical protein